MLHGERVPEVETSDRHDELPRPDPAGGGASDAKFIALGLALGMTAGLALDVGCGSGRRAILLAKLAPQMHVVGVDSSAALVARARDAARAAGLASRCAFLRGDPKRLPLASGRFDLVLCDGVLHHLGAALPALNEIERVGAPASAILIRDLRRPGPLSARLAAAWRAVASPAENRAALDASLRASFTPAELADLVRRSRLRGVRPAPSGFGHLLLLRYATPAALSSP